MIAGRPVTRRASLSGALDRLRARVAEEDRVERLRATWPTSVAARRVTVGSAKPIALDVPHQPVDLRVDRGRHARMRVAQRR